MAAETTQEPTSVDATATREADVIEADLRRLEDLQEQIDRLRVALPAIIAPLTRPNMTNLDRFNQLKKAAVGASTSVASLKENWTSGEAQAILKRADESLEKNPDLSKSADVPFYGWNDSP